MKTLRGGLVVLVSAAATCLIVLGATRAFGAGANTIPVSGNVALVPSYPGIPIQPLATSDLPRVNGTLAVTSAAALSAAEAFDGFTDAQVDPTIGIVRGIVSGGKTPTLQNKKAWMVTADIDDVSEGPGLGIVYHKRTVVVDAITGTVLFSYATDPTSG